VEKLNEKGYAFDVIRKRGMLADRTDVDDHFINSIVNELEAINDKIKIADVIRVMESEHCVNVDPFKVFREKMEKMPLKVGPVAETVSCIKLDRHALGYERLIKKWLGGIMGTICGSFSVMALVLVSKRQKIGKTLFFNNLLPDDLKHYLKWGTIDESRDGLIDLCNYLLYVDDEWTGKSKTEAATLKRLMSVDYITVRKMYGKTDERRKKIANLAGTGNESEVINHDFSGNRRIIPVRVESIDIERFLKINKDEVFRELYERQKADPTWWHLTDEDIQLLNSDTQENTAIDPYQDAVLTYTAPDPDGHVSISEIEAHIAAMNRAYRTNPFKLGRALAAEYGPSVQTRIDGQNRRVYPVRLGYPGTDFKNLYEFKQEALQ
jgi:hypothetical protein